MHKNLLVPALLIVSGCSHIGPLAVAEVEHCKRYLSPVPYKVLRVEKIATPGLWNVVAHLDAAKVGEEVGLTYMLVEPMRGNVSTVLLLRESKNKVVVCVVDLPQCGPKLAWFERETKAPYMNWRTVRTENWNEQICVTR